jgi:acetolactate synthase I/II/III large subunit
LPVLKAANYWAGYLKARGVERIFGLPGTESLELTEAIRAVGLEFFLTHHESTAAFLAAMSGHLTRTPGVCLATRGPGAMNLTSGIAAAFLDRMPLLAVTGDHGTDRQLPSHQRLPLTDFFAPITRASIRVQADILPEQMALAFAAGSGPPSGPVFLAFPGSETAKEIEVPPLVDLTPPFSSEPEAPDLTSVLDTLAAARRPMIVAGLGIPNCDASAELMTLVERLHCPVADTPQMKGCFPNDHRLYAGTFATHRDQSVTALANTADLILTLGLDSVEFLKRWSLTPPVISLTGDGLHDPAIPSRIVVDGPLPEMLRQLAAETRRADGWSSDEIAGCRAETLTSIMPPVSDDGRNTLWPQTVVSELQVAMPADGVVSVDVGSHKLLMVLQWIAREPQSFLNSSGISSMGSGIPFALAAKLTWPDRPVAAVIGDGGFLMYTGQLEALAGVAGPLLVIVMADAALYSIKIKQLQRNYPPVGTDFQPVAIAAIARDFGLHAERVTNRAECRAALAAGMRADRPTVIEAVIDPIGYHYSQ